MRRCTRGARQRDCVPRLPNGVRSVEWRPVRRVRGPVLGTAGGHPLRRAETDLAGGVAQRAVGARRRARRRSRVGGDGVRAPATRATVAAARHGAAPHWEISRCLAPCQRVSFDPPQRTGARPAGCNPCPRSSDPGQRPDPVGLADAVAGPPAPSASRRDDTVNRSHRRRGPRRGRPGRASAGHARRARRCRKDSARVTCRW